MRRVREDYRGPFEPNPKYQDFSKEALIKLLVEYSRAYQMIMGGWYDVLRDRYGDKAAIECDIAQWMVTGPMVVRFMSRALDIEGDGVEAFFRRLQVAPGFPVGICDSQAVPQEEQGGGRLPVGVQAGMLS